METRVREKKLQHTGEEKSNCRVETAFKKECRNLTKSIGNRFSKLLLYNSKPIKKYGFGRLQRIFKVNIRINVSFKWKYGAYLIEMHFGSKESYVKKLCGGASTCINKPKRSWKPRKLRHV